MFLGKFKLILPTLKDLGTLPLNLIANYNSVIDLGIASTTYAPKSKDFFVNKPFYGTNKLESSFI